MIQSNCELTCPIFKKHPEACCGHQLDKLIKRLRRDRTKIDYFGQGSQTVLTYNKFIWTVDPQSRQHLVTARLNFSLSDEHNLNLMTKACQARIGKLTTKFEIPFNTDCKQWPTLKNIIDYFRASEQ